MYEDYYGFTEKPFNLTPDPKYLYKSQSHSNAFDLLQYAIKRREGFVVITGDIGTGKTTLCRAILEQIDRRTFTALVLNPFLSEEDLLKLILQDFGVVSREEAKGGRLAGVSKQELVETLNDFLLSLLPIQAGAILIIDEAQNLPLQVLEQIRILSNLETDKEKLLQIVLVGQLNLQSLLKTPEMRQLDQRVSIRYELKPLDRDEVGAYVTHRLSVAGASSVVAFTPKALDQVTRYSAGIPRLVNLLCDRALLGAYSVRSNKILPEMVVTAAANLDLEPREPGFWQQSGQRLSTAAAACLAITLVGAAGAGLARQPETVPADRTTRAVQSEALRAPAPAVPSPSVSASTTGATRPAAGTARTNPHEVARDEAARWLISDTGRVTGPEPYSILIGSFGDRGLLRSTIRDLEELGLRMYLLDQGASDETSESQLLVGPYADARQAMQDEARLRQTAAFRKARLVVATDIED